MKKIQIKPEKHIFLKAKSDCSDDGTFYECIGSRIKNSYPIYHIYKDPKKKKEDLKCSKECSFFSFPKMDSYNISKDPITYTLIWQIFIEVVP